MLSRIGKVYVTEKVASIFKYLVKDAKSYPVHEEWTDKKMKRTYYLVDKTVLVDSMRAEVPEFNNMKVSHTEEIEHHLGCLPVVEMRNKQKWLYELMSPWFSKSNFLKKLKLKTPTCYLVSSKRDDKVCLPHFKANLKGIS